MEVKSTGDYIVSENEIYYHASIKVILPEELRQRDTLARQVQANIENTIGYRFNNGCPFFDTTAEPDQTIENADGEINGSDVIQNGCPARATPNGDSNVTYTNDSEKCRTARNNKHNQKDTATVCPRGRAINAQFHAVTDDTQRAIEPYNNNNNNAFSLGNFSLLFPFHIIFDRHMTIRQSGDTLVRLCPSISPGRRLDEVLSVVYPRVPFKLTALLDFFNALFVMQVKPLESSIPILLKGNRGVRLTSCTW